MRKTIKANLDALRRRSSDAENLLLDAALAGTVSRRDFLRHGSVLGLSLPQLSALGTAFGLQTLTTRRAFAAAPGGTVRVACLTPTTVIDPVTVGDLGGQIILQQTGEFLAISGPDLVLKPLLAESWKPNADGSVWTFALRRGVKFHNGAEMKADDVVASINRLADPAGASNALSVFTGVLGKGGAKKVDDYTVAFHLDAPNGNFPYLVSSDNYNAIIIPAAYSGDFEKHFTATGPFKLETYTTGVGASFVRNDDYWGTKALLDRTEFAFYADIVPQVLALQAGQVDVISQLPVIQGIPLLDDPNVAITSIRSSGHTQVHMRTDTAPFTDKRVRQAIALTLDRQKVVKGLFRGRADLGNDSPFAPVFPATDTGVAQRSRDIAQAKQLLDAAGFAKGLSVKLTVIKSIEIPAYCQLLQQGAREAGITIDLNIMESGAYYGDAVYGKSPWLDSPFGATDYGHRGAPNVLLSAPLKSDGAWNAAHFKNSHYDALVSKFVAALDIQSQRAAAGDIQKVLLDETPVIFGYFFNFLMASAKNVKGVQATALGQIFLGEASIG